MRLARRLALVLAVALAASALANVTVSRTGTFSATRSGDVELLTGSGIAISCMSSNIDATTSNDGTGSITSLTLMFCTSGPTACFVTADLTATDASTLATATTHQRTPTGATVGATATTPTGLMAPATGEALRLSFTCGGTTCVFGSASFELVNGDPAAMSVDATLPLVTGNSAACGTEASWTGEWAITDVDTTSTGANTASTAIAYEAVTPASTINHDGDLAGTENGAGLLAGGVTTQCSASDVAVTIDNDGTGVITSLTFGSCSRVPFGSCIVLVELTPTDASGLGVHVTYVPTTATTAGATAATTTGELSFTVGEAPWIDVTCSGGIACTYELTGATLDVLNGDPARLGADDTVPLLSGNPMSCDTDAAWTADWTVNDADTFLGTFGNTANTAVVVETD